MYEVELIDELRSVEIPYQKKEAVQEKNGREYGNTTRHIWGNKGENK